MIVRREIELRAGSTYTGRRGKPEGVRGDGPSRTLCFRPRELAIGGGRAIEIGVSAIERIDRRCPTRQCFSYPQGRFTAEPQAVHSVAVHAKILPARAVVLAVDEQQLSEHLLGYDLLEYDPEFRFEGVLGGEAFLCHITTEILADRVV